jgi:hypothetical protein
MFLESSEEYYRGEAFKHTDPVDQVPSKVVGSFQ